MPKGNDASRFLDAAFGDAPASTRILLWTFPQRHSQWFAPDELGAAVAAAEAADDRDVFVGVGLSPHDFGPRSRCDAKDITGIVGLWADVDYAHDVHKKAAQLPPDEASARQLVEAMGPTPTFVVHSGHGLQAWWLFDEPWIFDQPAEYEAAARLALRWNHTLRVRAAEHGWTIDSVFDLSRVLRLPGTNNCKQQPIVPCRIVEEHDVRYGPSDFDDYLADESALAFLAAPYKVGELRVHKDADPPFSKLSALLDNSRKAKATWERTGRQLASASEWDLSLASFAAQAEWSDQDIVDLLIAYRRKHADDPKLRVDYYARTIARARTARQRDEQDEMMRDVMDSAMDTLAIEGADTTSPDVLRAKRDLVNVVAARLGGIPLARVDRARSDPATFTLVFLDGRHVVVGDGGQMLTNSVRVTGLIEGETKIATPLFKRTDWKDVVTAIIHASEDVEVSEDATDAGLALSALNLYLGNRPLLPDRHEGAAVMEPFREDGHVYVFSSSFAAALERRGERVVRGMKLNTVMRAAGCEYIRHFNVAPNGKQTQRSVWRIPEHVVDELGLNVDDEVDA